MAANRKAKPGAALHDCDVSPYREENTSCVVSVKVPSERRALFLAVETDILHDKLSDELSFGALSPNERATFQFLLYLTYCCKGELLQVTLENPDFYSMSPPIREDFAHGRLFCFVLDVSKDTWCETNNESSRAPGDTEDYLSGSQMRSLMDEASVNMSVFRREGREDRGPSTASPSDKAGVEETLDEAFDAFMRLQLVRKKAVSLNNAMIYMRDSQGELSSKFDWVDIHSDTLNADKLDRKQVKELQGSMYLPSCQSGRQVVVLPEPITDLNLKALDEAIGRITDSVSKGEGKRLFRAILSKLTGTQWLKQRVVHKGYKAGMPIDVGFVERLKGFTGDLSRSPGSSEVDIRGLLVFRYSLEKLIDRESPDLFVRSLIHRHVPVTKARIHTVLVDIKGKRRTRELAGLLHRGRCHCKPGPAEAPSGPCLGECQTAYSCFYNSSDRHPFSVSKEDHVHYFAQLYPNLGRLERLSKEMKDKFRGRVQFGSIADMVFSNLVMQKFRENDSLYQGLGEVMDEQMNNSSFSLGHDLAEIHETLYLAPEKDRLASGGIGVLDPLKVYDRALVRYLFCDSLQVGRLFQASTTFNYIIANTAPRYTIERIMLFNITGPGEGKSYANNVLIYQFRRVRGCIESLTSFTPQAFKYKQKRTACVVIIDDGAISHEKTIRASDGESNVIPNTFKNLLDTSVLESDVVTRDASSGKVDTVKYQSVHNCGFVWNTNTMGFVTDAWADRSLVMDSEFPERMSRTRSTKQIQDTVDRDKMAHIAAVCLYRQNLIQSATMIAESGLMQFGERFDAARDACVAALHASHIVCTGVLSRRVPQCINQLVFPEAMKLACHFVYDIWIPPWTHVPDEGAYPELRGFMKRMNGNRLNALNELSFGEICLETNAVYKLCTAACLPDICPRVVDTQGRFACNALAYVLTQIHGQELKTALKNDHLCISGIDAMSFSENAIKGGNDVAHEMLTLCSTCKVPARGSGNPERKSYKLCSYRYAANANALPGRRARGNARKKVASVTISLEAVYDMLALYAPSSHSGFWEQVGAGMVEAYEKRDFEEGNAFGQCLTEEGEEQRPIPRLLFTLDLNGDPVRSLILEATAAIEPLNELWFNKCALNGETYRCSAPLYYGGVVKRAMSEEAPEGAYDQRHATESRQGRRGTFHGPRLNVYSSGYSGVPVKNMSSFCTTRTVYHQHEIHLTADLGRSGHLFELEEDWEWKDAAEAFNQVHGADAFSVDMLKRDYAATMMIAKGESITSGPTELANLVDMIRTLRESNGGASLALRKCAARGSDTQEHRGQRRPAGESPSGSSRARKRTSAHSSRGSATGKRAKKTRRFEEFHDLGD